MKKILYVAMSLLGLASMPVRAQVYYYEPFTYPDGNITNVSGLVWTTHSGTSGDSLISSNRYQVWGTRTDDVNRTFPTNKGTVFAAFTLNMSSLPVNANGTYFAHFKDSAFVFHARIYAVTGNGPLGLWNTAPGMYRIGIANGAADGNGAITNGPSKVFPMDLALGVDYQIITEYDPTNGSMLWVNPAVSTDPSTPFASDPNAVSTNGMSAYAFRQNTGQGKQTVDNLVVGATFNDVVTNIPLAAPVIGIQPVGTTNYSGNAFTMTTVATGPGALSYQWVQDGTPLSGANSSAYSISSLSAGDSGTYTVVVTNAFGSTTSAPTAISVNTTPTPPFFITQPLGVTNQISKPISLSPTVGGTGPLSFQWNQNGSPAPGPGANSLTYSLTQATTNDSGDYTLVVTGAFSPPATSSVATVLINPAAAETIGFLRGLEDTNTWDPTDTTTLFSATGVIINPFSLTTSTTTSYYIQDATGGINLFITGTTAFRPNLGDMVTAVGPLANFNKGLELSLDASNPFDTFSIVSTNNPLPTPLVFSPSSTNNLPYMESKEGSLILMTNVYFVKGGTTNKFAGGTSYNLTNTSGKTFAMFIGSQVTNLNGVPIPAFAWSLIGPLAQSKPSSSTNLNAGYEILVSQPSDITTTAPTAVTVSAATASGSVNLTWTAQPYHYSYSVFAATNVAGPYAPLAVGLVFTNTSGAYTDLSPSVVSTYYRITCP